MDSSDNKSLRVIFMGTPDFALPTLDALKAAGHEIVLVVTQPDRPKGRSGEPAPSPVKKWAVENGIDVFQPEKIREESAVNYIQSIDADVAVVAAFGQILPKSILDHPRLGCINVHASLLPKYRGAAPIQWAILNGDEITGVTIMQMGVGLDDGDILRQKQISIADEDTGGSLFDKLADLGGDLLVSTLSDLDAGRITPVVQNEDEATKVGMIHKDLGHLDFSRPADELWHYVRGLYPWPGAFAYFDDKAMIKIHSAFADPAAAPEGAKPGEILKDSKDEIRVATGSGVLCIKEVQAAGKKRMSASDYLRGHSNIIGRVLC